MSSTESPLASGTGQTVRSDNLQVYRDADDEMRGIGWLFFAGTMLGLAGCMRILDSLWAFSYNGALPDRLQDGLLGDNLNTYGWTWLIVGLVLIGASILVIMRNQFARWVGFIAAGIAALTAMTWMPYYPIWALTYVGLAVLTFYALAKFGGREGP